LRGLQRAGCAAARVDEVDGDRLPLEQIVVEADDLPFLRHQRDVGKVVGAPGAGRRRPGAENAPGGDQRRPPRQWAAMPDSHGARHIVPTLAVTLVSAWVVVL